MTKLTYKDRFIKAHKYIMIAKKDNNYYQGDCPLCAIGHDIKDSKRNVTDICHACTLRNDNHNRISDCYGMITMNSAYIPNKRIARVEFHKKAIEILKKLPANRFGVKRKGAINFPELIALDIEIGNKHNLSNNE